MWKRIKKHPRLVKFFTVALAITAYFVVPIIGIPITPWSVGIAAAICSIGGLVLGGFLGWVGQKIGLIPPITISHPDKNRQFHKVEKIPQVVVRDILARNLDLKDLEATAGSSRHLYHLLKPRIREAKLEAKLEAKFLQHITHDEQKEAEEMLGIEKKKEILLSSTVFQYVLQKKKWVMWEMLLRYLPPTQILEQSVARFFQHVVHGEQKEAEAMLIKEKSNFGFREEKEEKCAILSKLLTTKASVRDLSGREFNPLTAIHFVFWAKDQSMWEMFEKYLPVDNVSEQHKEHKNQGVSYVLEGKKIEKEYHYDFFPLIEALEQYIHYAEIRNVSSYVPVDWTEVKKRWLEYGAAQRYVPAHVANKYTPMRPLFFMNYITELSSAWFSDANLGVTFAIESGEINSMARGIRADRFRGRVPLYDSSMLCRLSKAATEAYKNLDARYEVKVVPAAPSSFRPL